MDVIITSWLISTAFGYQDIYIYIYIPVRSDSSSFIGTDNMPKYLYFCIRV